MAGLSHAVIGTASDEVVAALVHMSSASATLASKIGQQSGFGTDSTQ